MKAEEGFWLNKCSGAVLFKVGSGDPQRSSVLKPWEQAPMVLDDLHTFWLLCESLSRLRCNLADIGAGIYAGASALFVNCPSVLHALPAKMKTNRILGLFSPPGSPLFIMISFLWGKHICPSTFSTFSLMSIPIVSANSLQELGDNHTDAMIVFSHCKIK